MTPPHVPPGEEVKHLLRKHWFVYAQSALPSVVIFCVIIGGLLYVWNEFSLSEHPTYAKVILFGILAYALFEWSLLFIKWINYYLDVWIITTERIIAIEQYTLFARKVSEIRFDRVQDITVLINGILPTVLGYGDIEVQSAGAHEKFVIGEMSNPYHVRDLISREVDRVAGAVRVMKEGHQ